MGIMLVFISKKSCVPLSLDSHFSPSKPSNFIANPLMSFELSPLVFGLEFDIRINALYVLGLLNTPILYSFGKFSFTINCAFNKPKHLECASLFI